MSILYLFSLFSLFISASLDCIGVKELEFSSSNGFLSIEILSDSLIHIEHSHTPIQFPIYITQMIDPESYARHCGPATFTRSGNEFQTQNLLVIVSDNLEILVFDKIAHTILTEFTPRRDGLTWKRANTTAIYGIASAFAQDSDFGSSNGNFLGKRYDPQQIPNKPLNHPRFGNVMHAFDKGFAAACQFPIMYAKSRDSQFAFFFDNVYAHTWDMTSDTDFTVSAQGRVRWFIMHGTSLKSLRKRYMQLVGGPLVPPKEYFGFQHSLFGFKSFDEMLKNVEAVRDANIPQDGMVLDLHWFGGQSARWVDGDPDTSRFGTLQWDVNFPYPQANIGNLRSEFGVGVTLIEEPYIAKKSQMYKKLAESFALVQDWKYGPPTTIEYNTWWGRGGLIDWTSPSSTLWHDCKRCALVTGCKVDPVICIGIDSTNFSTNLSGHWVDLGEPELLNAWERFYGYVDSSEWITDEAGVHNIYQLLSSKALFDGYTRSNLTKRPFSIIRTGTSGIHRYGSVLWSGDISSYLPVLANHYGAQKHAIMGGIDYFGSDIGGFHRNGILDREELAQKNITVGVSFTLWLANSVFTDIPVRTHCSQTRCDDHGRCVEDLTMQTNPATVGNLESNRYNIRTRYELFPYYYSLAHAAHTDLDPVFMPMFLAFESDLNCESIGDQIMVGPFIMVAHVTEYHRTERRVYLPAGAWFDYRTHEKMISKGQFYTKPAYHTLDYGRKIHVVPLLVRGGSVVPRIHIDDESLNNYGVRRDGSHINTQIVRVWPDDNANTSFAIYDDDGSSIAYLSGYKTMTLVTLKCRGMIECMVAFYPTTGTFEGALKSRVYSVEFIVPDQTLEGISVSVLVDSVNMKLEYRDSADYIKPIPSYSPIKGTALSRLADFRRVRGIQWRS